MLHRYCSQFLAYCQLADFSARSIQALTIRLNEFKAFLKSQRIRSVKKITYQHLINLAIGVGPRELIDIYELTLQK